MTWPYWHDDIGKTFGALMEGVDAILLGRRTYVTHAQAFEPMPAGDPFGDLMNAPRKFVVSRTLERPIWRNTTIVRENAIAFVRELKSQEGGTILTDGSSELVHALLEHEMVDELHAHITPAAALRPSSQKALNARTRDTAEYERWNGQSGGNVEDVAVHRFCKHGRATVVQRQSRGSVQIWDPGECGQDQGSEQCMGKPSGSEVCGSPNQADAAANNEEQRNNRLAERRRHSLCPLPWLYLCSAALLIGGELNSEIENAAAQQGDPNAKLPDEKVPHSKAGRRQGK